MIYHNFKPSEYACKCGCGLQRIDPRQLDISEIVRAFEGGKPYVPNSGCRCRKHNEAIQFKYVKNYVALSSNSWHLPKDNHGKYDIYGICHAVDYGSKNPKSLYKLLTGIFPDTYGIICYRWGVHFDFRPTKYRKSWI